MNGRRSALGTLGASAALAAVLALAGCASSGTGSTGSSGTGDGMGHDEHATTGADATSEANAADIMFAQMMLPHHEQALEMSGIVLAKDGVDADVAELAEQIEAAQGPEIEQLESWLDEWGAPAAGNDMAMDGMLSEAELDELEAADGASASQVFLEQMIAHHEGAVAMAEEHLENGAHEGALAMSDAIIESQTTEITQMREMLAG